MEGAGMKITAPEGFAPRPYDQEEGDEPIANAEDAAEIPAAEEAATGQEPEPEPQAEPEVQPEAEPQPQFEDIFKERIGMTPDEVMAVLNEVDTLKKRVFVDDDELVARDELSKNFLRVHNRGGDVKSFVNSVFADYAKMTNEEIIKHDILSADANMPKALLERKYNAKLAEMGWHEDIEPDDRDYNEVVAYEANKLREKHLSKAKEYQLPEKAPAAQGQQEVDTAEREKYQREFLESEPVKNLQLNKKVTFGDFDYVVNPSEIIALMSDPAKLGLKFTNPDGSPDMPKMIKWYAAAPDIDGVIKSAVDAAVKQERLNTMKRDTNPSSPAPVQPTGAPPKLNWGSSRN